MTTKSFGYLTTLLTLLVLVLLSGCGFSSEVVLKNDSGVVLSGVQVFAATEEIWRGEVKPGQRIKIAFNAAHDGTLRVTGRQDGTAFDSGELGYVTPNAGVYHTINISHDGKTDYDYSPNGD